MLWASLLELAPLYRCLPAIYSRCAITAIGIRVAISTTRSQLRIIEITIGGRDQAHIHAYPA